MSSNPLKAYGRFQAASLYFLAKEAAQAVLSSPASNALTIWPATVFSGFWNASIFSLTIALIFSSASIASSICSIPSRTDSPSAWNADGCKGFSKAVL